MPQLTKSPMDVITDVFSWERLGLQLGVLAVVGTAVRFLFMPLLDSVVITSLRRNKSGFKELLRDPGVIGEDLAMAHIAATGVDTLATSMGTMGRMVQLHEDTLRQELPRLSEGMAVNTSVTEAMEKAVTSLSGVLQDIHESLRAVSKDHGKIIGFLERRQIDIPVEHDRRGKADDTQRQV